MPWLRHQRCSLPAAPPGSPPPPPPGFSPYPRCTEIAAVAQPALAHISPVPALPLFPDGARPHVQCSDSRFHLSRRQPSLPLHAHIREQLWGKEQGQEAAVHRRDAACSASPGSQSPLQLSPAPGSEWQRGQKQRGHSEPAAPRAVAQTCPLRRSQREEGIPQRSPQGHSSNLPIRNSLSSPQRLGRLEIGTAHLNGSVHHPQPTASVRKWQREDMVGGP